MRNLDSLFNPKNIAVIGVSENPNKIGSVIYHNIINSGYEGKLFIINPKHDELFGQRAYNGVGYIQEEIDLVVIAIPGAFVLDSVKECVKKQVKNIIIISAGFSEVGEEGKKLEEEVIKLARDGGVNVLGPNCLGIINPLNKLNASFAAQNALPGNIAFVSQSGALCTMVLDMAAKDRLGFGHFVSLGNKADINELDFIRYWNKLDEIQVIAAYLEEIENGDEFFKLARELKKPLVILTPGKTEQAQKAISSHTGSITTSSNIISAVVEQAGLIRVDSPDELFNAMVSLSWGKKLAGNKVAIVTNAGGPGVIATDLLIESGFNLAEFSQKTNEALKPLLPAEASIKNPVDLLGTALSNEYINSVKIISEDENVDVIFVVVTPQLITQIEETAKSIIQMDKQTEKNIIGIFLGGRYADTAIKRMLDNEVPAFNSLDRAVNACKYLLRISKKQEKMNQIKIVRGKHREEVKSATLDKLKTIDTKLSEEIIKEFGIDVPKQMVAYSEKELDQFIDTVGFPIVMKATSEDIVHKTEFKAVYLNIKTPTDLYNKFFRLRSEVAKHTGKTKVGVLLQEQIVGGEELFIGIKRDGSSNVYTSPNKGFGHLMVFGKGGIYTEVYKDFSFALVPFDEEEVLNMIKKTKVSAILFGTRGKKALAYRKLIETMMDLQRMVFAYPEIAEMDINPLIVTPRRAIAVDVKLFTQI